MSSQRSSMRCREARRLFPAVAAGFANSSDAERANSHAETCTKCEMELRFASLSLAAMNGAAADEPNHS